MARFLKANTATIVTVGPFYDKTDGVTIEGSLTITNEKITMTVDNNDGSAPTIVLDNVTGATSGTDNDLNYITNCDAGLMQLELSASNTNHAGKRAMITITDAANHVPVFHEFMILPANVFDSLFAGSDYLQTHAVEIANDLITAAAIATGAIDADAIADNAIDAGALAADCITSAKIADNAIAVEHLADGAITAAKIANGAIDAATFAADVDAEAAAWIWNAAAGSFGGAGTYGQAVEDILVDTGTTLQAELDGIQADTEDLQTQIGVAGAGLTAVPWNAAWDAEVQSEVFDALDAAFTDATSLTSNGLLDRIRTLGWIMRNKIAVTDANGNTVIYKDDSTTAAFTVSSMLTDDSTTTTRLRAA